jgi:hypothetical protein
MNSKLVTVTLGALLSVSLMAEPGTYKGTGKVRSPGGTLVSTYTASLVLKEISPKSLYEVDETWVTADGRKGGSTLTFHFNADGTFRVKRNNVDVGCGYSFDDQNGHWMDYKVQSEQGPVHINQYYSKTEKRLLRMGDGILNGQILFWTDSLVKE